jgi:hypothetical protein
VKRALAAIATLASAAALAVAAMPAPAVARTVTSGVITVGQGAGPITLGMSRAQVISKLGRPLYENQNGYMQYARIPVIFDVYRDGGASSTHVRMLGISAMGPAFRLSDGNRIFTKGGLRRLSAHYGKQLKFHNTADSGPFYEIVSTLHKRKVLTDFFVDRHSLSATVLDVFILFG